MMLIIALFAGFGTFIWFLGLAWFYVLPLVVLFAVGSWWFSDKLVLSATRAKVVTAEEEPELHEMVNRLCQRANMPVPKIAVVKTDTPNAFATGKSRKSSVIAVTTGLRKLLNKEELEGVLAHELGHVRHRDVTVLAVANLFVAITSFLMSVFFWNAIFGGRRSNDSGATPILLAYLVTVIVYFIGLLLVLSLTRHREYLADHAGAELSGNPRALAQALYKIKNVTSRVPPEKLSQLSTARAFCIIPAVPKNDFTSALSTHPPTEKRIERLLKLEKSEKEPDYTFHWQTR